MKPHMRISSAILVLAVGLATVPAVAQDFVTPSMYFDRVSEKFGSIQDMRARITIRQGEDDEEPMQGTLLYKSPNKLRIDFEQPREQVLAVTGDMLTVYVPRYSYILEQQLQRRSEASLALMASNKELTHLKNNYSVAYLVGPDPVPLAEGSEEMVTKLKFQSLSSVEGFRELEIAVDENDMIRRVIGRSGGNTLVMDYRNVETNLGLPDARFEYEAPANANVFRNFLFEVIE